MPDVGQLEARARRAPPSAPGCRPSARSRRAPARRPSRARYTPTDCAAPWWSRSIGSSRQQSLRRARRRATSACARSATRSSADSIPTESRIEVRAARRTGASAVDAWVIAAGCSMRLSTPPSALGERADSFVRGDELDGLLLGVGEERDHPAEVAHLARGDLVAGMVGQAGVEHLLDCRVLLEEARRRRGRSRSAGSMRTASVLIPRRTSQQSNGPGHGAERLLQEVQPLGDGRVVRRARSRRPRRSGRRGTSSSSGRRCRRRARAAAGGTAWRTCCRRRRSRRPRARRRRPRGCRRCSAAGSSASRSRRCRVRSSRCAARFGESPRRHVRRTRSPSARTPARDIR